MSDNKLTEYGTPLLFAAAFLSGFSLFSKLYYHRSAPATAAELCLRMANVKGTLTDKEKYEKYADLMSRFKKDCIPNFIGYESEVKRHILADCPVYSLTPKKSYNAVVIYLHGGSYAMQALGFHWRFCDRLANAVGAKVFFPVYPLAPEHSWKESYDLLDALWSKISESTKKPVTIMGDSAGGGLAAGFCEHLGKNGQNQPARLILLSPWLDITLSNPEIAEYDKVDPMLSLSGLRDIGPLWADDLDPRDYRVSPLYGDISVLRNVYLFAGTREMFYPDVSLFRDKLKEAGCDTHMYTGNGLNHVFPLYPTPEANKAFKTICAAIRSSMP